MAKRAYNEARNRATQKYHNTHCYRISITLPIDMKSLIHDRAKDCGGSVNAYVTKLIYQDIGIDDYEEPEREAFYDAP